MEERKENIIDCFESQKFRRILFRVPRIQCAYVRNQGRKRFESSLEKIEIREESVEHARNLWEGYCLNIVCGKNDRYILRAPREYDFDIEMMEFMAIGYDEAYLFRELFGAAKELCWDLLYNDMLEAAANTINLMWSLKHLFAQYDVIDDVDASVLHS